MVDPVARSGVACYRASPDTSRSKLGIQTGLALVVALVGQNMVAVSTLKRI